MMSLEEISSHIEIRQVLAAYARGVDRWDAALLKTCYHQDAVDHHTMFNGNGWDFADWVVTLCANAAGVSQHHITNAHVQMDGLRANVESYYLAYHQYTDQAGSKVMQTTAGRYLDRFTQRDGTWKIAKRVCTVDWSQAPVPIESWQGATAFPPIGPAGADPMYSLFAEP